MSGESKVKYINSNNLNTINEDIKAIKSLVSVQESDVLFGTPGTVSADIAAFQNNFNFVQTSFVYDNFKSIFHFENKKEYRTIDQSFDIFKMQVNINYNFLIRNFEEYLQNISEHQLPSFYSILNGKILDNPNVEKFSGQSIFDDPVTNLAEYTDDPPNPYTIFPFDFGEEIKKILNFSDLKNYFKNLNSFKEQFPLYTEIFVDAHVFERSNTFLDIIEKNNFFVEILTNHRQNSRESNYSVKTESRFGTTTENINLVQSTIPISLLLDLKEEFRAELKKFVKVKTLNYKQISQNDLCYTEVIGYRIDKYDVKSNNPTAIETWYVPNINSEKIEIIDNRIKYQKLYIYKVSPIIMVLANNISFLSSKKENGKLEIQFVNQPVFKIIEVESSRYENRLIDAAPIEPEVEVIPYISVDNTVKFILTTGIGTKSAVPIIFNSQELIDYNKIKEGQDRLPQDPKITFSSEEPSEYFVIYKSEIPPSSYADFINSSVRTVASELNSSAASFNEVIRPNKKYYYTFRSVDYHGHISNPSPVYEIELTNDNGKIYPNFQIYNFQKNDKLIDPNKPFRRFLYIAPSYRQKLPNYDPNLVATYNTVDLVKQNVSLGESGAGSVWNKKFKIRVTSKSTGRSTDINVIFSIDKE